MRAKVVALVGVFLASCVASPPPSKTVVEKGVPIRLSAAQTAAVYDGVKVALKDPDSARFGGAFGARSSSGLVSVCGMVNARNSFGGYVGNTGFYGVLIEGSNGRAVFTLMKLADTEVNASVVLTMCRDTGVY